MLKPVFLDSTAQKLVEATERTNALLGVIASSQKDAYLSDWTRISETVTSGLASKLFQPGDQLVDKWSDTATSTQYDVPWGVRHFKNVELQDGEIVPGMILQWDYATPFGVQFSHPRAFLKCPEGLNAGTYFFTLGKTWGTNCVQGDKVSFTVQGNHPEGVRVAGCYYAPDQEKSNWRIYVYSADGKEILETIVPTFTASGYDLGTMAFDTRNGNLNSMQEMAFGWNRWKTSALRQWLNSNKTKGNWWVAQDEWDIAPEQLATKDGFLRGMPEKLLKVIKPTKIVTYTNTVQDGGEADVTYDKIFLPSLQEMHINPQISGEGETWDYWLRASQQSAPLTQWQTYPQMITYAIENHTSPQTVRLRSAGRGNAYGAWGVGSSGGIGYYNASSAFRVAPACVMC